MAVWHIGKGRFIVIICVCRAGEYFVLRRRRPVQADVAFHGLFVGDISGSARVGQRIAVVPGIHVNAQIDLFQIVQTRRSLGPGFRPGQDRQQQSDQDGDDRNDHKQFNQGKSAARFHGLNLGANRAPVERFARADFPAAIFRNGAASSFRAKQIRVKLFSGLPN